MKCDGCLKEILETDSLAIDYEDLCVECYDVGMIILGMDDNNV